MWTVQSQQLDSQTIQTKLSGSSGILSFREVTKLWCNQAEFRELFTASISDSPFEAFFRETPAVSNRNWNRPFAYVLVQSAALSRLHPDFSPFEAHFLARPSEEVLTFPNLGGDAVLVVPTPLVNEACYPHLGRFLRTAPPSQADALWQRVGLAMQERVSNLPVWLSTAGMGVSWLHLRLDSRPKYYRHPPYKV